MSAVLATIGHNNPPELTPFEQSASEIDGLVTEAKNWLDGSGVNSETDAAAVSKLIDELRKAGKKADERRIAENKPFDEGKAEVQARYNPLIQKDRGVVDVAIKAAKDALAPFLKRKADALAAEQAEARHIADDKAAAAVEAMRASRQGEADLEARQHAEALVVEAKQAEKSAKKAEGTKAHATGGTRAIGLRTVWKGEVTDANAFARWVWTNRNAELLTFFADLAQREVHGGTREMAGVTITEEKVL